MGTLPDRLVVMQSGAAILLDSAPILIFRSGGLGWTVLARINVKAQDCPVREIELPRPSGRGYVAVRVSQSFMRNSRL